MRAKEFIKEGNSSKGHPEHLSALSYSMTVPNMDSYHEYYKFMTAVAVDDSKVPTDHDHFNENPILFAYTPEEKDMLLRGLKRMGKKPKYVTNGKSKEHKTTNSSSPVAAIKKNRYGI